MTPKNKEVKIALPKNCEAKEIKTSVKDNFIVVNYSTKENYVPKAGDIIFMVTQKDNKNYDGDQIWISIYKSETEDAHWDYVSYDIIKNNLMQYPTFMPMEGIISTRLATETEKKLLFDKLKEHNHQWNTEKKRVEEIPWTPKYKEFYFSFLSNGEIYNHQNINDDNDFKLISFGNCFKDEATAKIFVDKIKTILKNR